MPDRGRSEYAGGDGDDDAGESLLEELPGIIAVTTFGIAALAAVTGSGQLAAVIAVVGWFLLTPLSGILVENEQARDVARRAFGGRASRESADTVGDDEAALEELKRRYARGEIDEAEFEHRTAMLLENESVDDVADRVERTPDVDADDRTIPRDDPGDNTDTRDSADKRKERAEREFET